MRSLTQFTLAVLLATLVSLSLQNPLPCACPLTDEAGNPLIGQKSDSSELFCLYGPDDQVCGYLIVSLPCIVPELGDILEILKNGYLSKLKQDQDNGNCYVRATNC
jgi:hypothetical protein